MYHVFYNPDCHMYGVKKWNEYGKFWQQAWPPTGKGGRCGQSAYTRYKRVAHRWMSELEEGNQV